MTNLIIGKTATGAYYVRPIDWAGVWNSEGELEIGRVLFDSIKEEECKRYVNRLKLAECIQENPTLPVIVLLSDYTVTNDFKDLWDNHIENVEIADIYFGEKRVYIKGKG